MKKLTSVKWKIGWWRVHARRESLLVYPKRRMPTSPEKLCALRFDTSPLLGVSGAQPRPRAHIAGQLWIRGRAKQPAAYYYVRVMQRYSAAEPEAEGEIAWSSPIFVYRGN